MKENRVVTINAGVYKARLFLIILMFAACEYNTFQVIEEHDCTKSTLTLSLLKSKQLTDCKAANGSIEVITSGGIPPYTYTIRNGVSQSSPVFAQLFSGSYTIIVTDAKNCSDTLIHELTNFQNSLKASAKVFSDSLCLSNTYTGLINVSVKGGAKPYLFQINNDTVTKDSVFAQLKHGGYTVIISDNNHCNYHIDVNVPRKTSGVSWLEDVKPIIQVSCVKSGCHDNLSGRTSLETFADVKKNVNQIRQRVINRSMPFDASLPDAQILTIVCWIDDGALEN